MKMKSFEVNYRGVTTTISAKNEESIVILINDSQEQAFIYAGSTDHDKKSRKVWFSNEPIKPDDVIDIKVIESDGMTESAIMTDIANIKSPVSKLESFYKLEALLKKRGLL